MSRAIVIVLLMVTCLHAAPTDDIRAMVKDQQYPAALQKIATTLQLKGPAATGVNRFELYMLKAECHLQTKAVTMAIEGYTIAAKEAKESTDRESAMAHELLVRRCKAFAYQPKTGQEKGKPPITIDILNPDNRKKAFAALLDDELAANTAKIEAAKKATSLLPVLEVFKTVATLEGLERAGSGKLEKTKGVMLQLSEQSKKLIADALRQLTTRTTAIDKDAGQLIEFNQEALDTRYTPPRVRIEKAYKKKGLDRNQMGELESIAATCDKISPAAEMFTQALPEQAKSFNAFVEDASKLRKEVSRILDVDYMTVYKDKSGAR